MRVRTLVEALDRITPTMFAAGWDNVGLLVGDPELLVDGPVLVTLDLTDTVIDEAVERRAGFVVAYHPPLFHAAKRYTSADRSGRMLVKLLRAGMAGVYSPHSALDAVQGGLNDWLIELVAAHPRPESIINRRPLEPIRRGGGMKLVVFVPEDGASVLREALHRAGAGIIGEYDYCTFATPGEGTFRAGESANPAVGQRGRVERVRELRIETVVPSARVGEVVAALRAAHPYEEPAFDLYRVEPHTDLEIGAGRIGDLVEPLNAGAVARHLSKHLGVAGARVALPDGWDNQRAISRVACCPGAGAGLLDAAITQGAELFVTGEMRHHELLSATERGLAVVLAGHTNTERPYMCLYAERIKDETGLEVIVSQRDRCPWEWVSQDSGSCM